VYQAIKYNNTGDQICKNLSYCLLVIGNL